MILENLIDFWYDIKQHVFDKIFYFLGYEPIIPEANSDGLICVNEDDPKWIIINKIIVPSEFDKQQLILAFKYLHDNRLIDTDLIAVNTIVHVYQRPDIIVVDNK